ncbi:MAG: transmembrane 220 family protein [Bacteroidota bacterium]
MRTFYIILSVLFTFFAIVQLNDVDPFFWVLYYLFIALLAGAASFGKYNKYGIMAALAITIFELVMLFPEFQAWMRDGMPSIVESMKAESPYIEFVREFLGLFIGLLAIIFLLTQRNRIGQRAHLKM